MGALDACRTRERDRVIDRHWADQLETALAGIKAPITVLDAESAADLAEGECVQQGEQLYLLLPRMSAALCCPAGTPGGEDLLRMAAALADALVVSPSRMENSADVYRRVLGGELSGAELEALTHEHQLPHDLERCVMVFHIVETGNARAWELLDELTPLQGRDVLIDMDRHTAALIKDMSDEESLDELIQYGQALQETLVSETARQMTVGIGRTVHTMEELRESYSEAKRAIEVGRVFHPEESIYAYGRLILERLLTELPSDVSAAYHNMLFNRRTARLFNEEMLFTIDMFFKKDLNLSDTARQLYIHRNTLVYRLDKVQRQTGLDLRSFEDAVTFKILMELKNCAGRK